jgi:hypothetical protein
MAAGIAEKVEANKIREKLKFANGPNLRCKTIVYEGMMVRKLNLSYCLMFLSEFVLICARSR